MLFIYFGMKFQNFHILDFFEAWNSIKNNICITQLICFHFHLWKCLLFCCVVKNFTSISDLFFRPPRSEFSIRLFNFLDDAFSLYPCITNPKPWSNKLMYLKHINPKLSNHNLQSHNRTAHKLQTTNVEPTNHKPIKRQPTHHNVTRYNPKSQTSVSHTRIHIIPRNPKLCGTTIKKITYPVFEVWFRFIFWLCGGKTDRLEMHGFRTLGFRFCDIELNG